MRGSFGCAGGAACGLAFGGVRGLVAGDEGLAGVDGD
jgi:hypothetical protein